MQSVAAPKHTTRKPARQEPIQVNIRLSPQQVDDLDEWLELANEARGWPKLTRTDVIRNLLAWGLRERPPWAVGAVALAGAATGTANATASLAHIPGTGTEGSQLALMPAHDITLAKQLLAAGRVRLNRRKSSDIVQELLDLSPLAADSFIFAVVTGLGEADFAHTVTEKAPPADVYGVFVDGRGWYVKIAIDSRLLLVISCHPPEAPLRTHSGTVTARI
jgi:hypothetical protein